MNKWLWLMWIPSLLFAAPPEPQQAVGPSKLQRLMESRAQSEQSLDQTERSFIPPSFQNRRQDPIYVDVEAHQLTIYPEKTVVSARDLLVEGNAFESFLDGVEKIKDTRHITLLLRPGSAVFQRQLRQAIRDRGIDVGFEPWEAGRAIVLPPPPESTRSSSAEQQAPAPTVLVATPKEIAGDSQTPVFFECRHQQLFSISLERLKQACDDKTAELRKAVDGDEAQFLRSAATTLVELDGQQLDFTYALMGKYVLTPVPDAKGYSFESHLKETDDLWYGSQLANLDPETQSLCFFVRPDSFTIFQQARALAGVKHLTVTCELLDENEPIMLGPGGEQLSY